MVCHVHNIVHVEHVEDVKTRGEVWPQGDDKVLELFAVLMELVKLPNARAHNVPLTLVIDYEVFMHVVWPVSELIEVLAKEVQQ